MKAIEVLNRFVRSNEVVVKNHKLRLEQALEDIKEIKNRIHEVEKENEDIKATIFVLEQMEKGDNS
ncbi:hypothetical protein [Bacillus toyonensis]|uniref:hypothetical protein n=1 Tax=Bacillus toyonensis TaxID=155322 RepID=UPI00027BEAA6|nr:hypothetical protein [Bacillus toyonensis]EJV41774.1 hypothetical protein IEA_05659 [Bacillus toyonensis]